MFKRSFLQLVEKLLLDHAVFGNPNGQTVMFVAGWPDTYSLFRNNLMAQLEDDYRIVGITLPGYEQPATQTYKETVLAQNGAAKTVRDMGYPALGHSPKKTSELLGNTFAHLLPKSSSSTATSSSEKGEAVTSSATTSRSEKGQTATSSTAVKGSAPAENTTKPILVCHDWGTVFSWEFVHNHPDFFDRVVLLDVGGNLSTGDDMATTLKRAFFFITYQWFIIIISYLMPAARSERFLHSVGKAMGRPDYKDCASGKLLQPSWRMAWPYWRMYWAAATGNQLETSKRCVPIPVPTLYIYSPAGLVPFHSQQWMKAVEERSKADGGLTRAVAVKGAHWFFALPSKKFDASRQIIVDFVRQKIEK